MLPRALTQSALTGCAGSASSSTALSVLGSGGGAFVLLGGRSLLPATVAVLPLSSLGSLSSGRGYASGPNSKGFFETFINKLKEGASESKELKDAQKKLEEFQSSDSLKKAKDAATKLSTAASATAQEATKKVTEAATIGMKLTQTATERAMAEAEKARAKVAESELGKKATVVGAAVTDTVGKRLGTLKDVASDATSKMASAASVASEKAVEASTIVGADRLLSQVKEATDRVVQTIDPSLRPQLGPAYRRKEDLSPEELSASTAVAIKRVGEWEQRWQALKASAPVQKVVALKKQFDESDNKLVVAVRDTSYKTAYFVSDWAERLMPTSSTAMAVSVIRENDPNFDIERFLVTLRKDFIPTVLKAAKNCDLEAIRANMGAAAYYMTEERVNAILSANLKNDSLLLDIRDVELQTAEVASDGNVYVAVTFKTQEVEIIRDASGKVVEGDPDAIQGRSYFWILQQHEFNPERWIVSDIKLFDIQGML